jgi:hypothetical protein
MTAGRIISKLTLKEKAEQMKKAYRWYFLRIAVLIVPWRLREQKNPKGRSCRFCYLIHATSLRSAQNKAEWIMSTHESVSGTAEVKGKRVVVFKVGILDLEQLQERVQDGVEIFEEACEETTMSEVRKTLLKKEAVQREIKKEKQLGFLPMLSTYWGEEYTKL